MHKPVPPWQLIVWWKTYNRSSTSPGIMPLKYTPHTPGAWRRRRTPRSTRSSAAATHDVCSAVPLRLPHSRRGGIPCLCRIRTAAPRDTHAFSALSCLPGMECASYLGTPRFPSRAKTRHTRTPDAEMRRGALSRYVSGEVRSPHRHTASSIAR